MDQNIELQPDLGIKWQFKSSKWKFKALKPAFQGFNIFGKQKLWVTWSKISIKSRKTANFQEGKIIKIKRIQLKNGWVKKSFKVNDKKFLKSIDRLSKHKSSWKWEDLYWIRNKIKIKIKAFNQ